MKTSKFSDKTLLVDQIIIDYNKNILINLYNDGDRFFFRFICSQLCKLIDPVNNSKTNDWGYGGFASPEEAVDNAQSIYSIRRY